MGLVVSQQRREVLLATEDNGLNGVGLYAWIDTGVPIDAMQWCKSMASAEGGPFCYWVPKPSLSIFFCQPQFKDVGVGVLRIHHIDIISMATSSGERPCY